MSSNKGRLLSCLFKLTKLKAKPLSLVINLLEYFNYDHIYPNTLIFSASV